MKRVALAAGLALYWILSIAVFSDNFGSHVRFVNDDYDRLIFAQRGSWALEGLVPYRKVFSEYPHVATYVLGLPYLLVRGDYASYRAVFSLLMSVCLGATIVLLQRLRPDRASLAYLMLLPAPLYFTINRFDVLASLFVLLAYWYLQRGRDAASGACLAVATLTKWYPGLLLPLCLSYVYRRDRRFGWTLLLAFTLTSVVIVTPSLIGAGPRAILRSYAFHAGRGLELVSLPALLHLYAQDWLGLTVPDRVLSVACLGGVSITVAAAVGARVDTMARVWSWSVVILSVALLLSTVWSPQWVLWVLPLMILIARTPSDVLSVVAYGVISYLVFPIIYDGLHGFASIPVKVGSIIIYAILIRTVIVVYTRDEPNQPPPRLWRSAAKAEALGAEAEGVSPQT